MGGEYQVILDALTQKKKENFATNAYLDAAKSIQAMPEMGGGWAGGGGWASQLAQGIAKGAAIGGLRQTGLNDVETADDEQNRMLAEYADAIKGGDPDAQAAIEQSGMIPQVPAAVRLSQAMGDVAPRTGGLNGEPVTLAQAEASARLLKVPAELHDDYIARTVGAPQSALGKGEGMVMRVRSQDPTLQGELAGARKTGVWTAEERESAKVGQLTSEGSKYMAKLNDSISKDRVTADYEVIKQRYQQLKDGLHKNSPAANVADIYNFIKLLNGIAVVRKNEVDLFENQQSLYNSKKGEWMNMLKGEGKLQNQARMQIMEMADVIKSAVDRGYGEYLHGKTKGIATLKGVGPAGFKALSINTPDYMRPMFSELKKYGYEYLDKVANEDDAGAQEIVSKFEAQQNVPSFIESFRTPSIPVRMKDGFLHFVPKSFKGNKKAALEYLKKYDQVGEE